MARTRDNRPGRALPPASDNADDDVIIGEVVNPQLVNARTIEKFAEQDRNKEDFKDFLATVNNFTREQAAINREHAGQHPDAIDHRKTKAFRRYCYIALISFAGALIIAMPFVNLVVAGTFGIIVTLIVCGVMLNARDRELDLGGMLQMIQAIIRGRP